MLNPVAQFPSRQRDWPWRPGLQLKDRRQLSRPRTFWVQSDLLHLDENTTEVRLLCSTGVTPLPRSYEPVRLPAAAEKQVMISPPPLSAFGLTSLRTPRRVSQRSALVCRRALSPITPGGPTGASARCFPAGNRLRHIWKGGHRHKRNEAESGSLTLGLAPLPSRGCPLSSARYRRADRAASHLRLPSRAGPQLPIRTSNLIGLAPFIQQDP